MEQNSQSQLKLLVAKGKEQGYLTLENPNGLIIPESSSPREEVFFQGQLNHYV